MHNCMIILKGLRTPDDPQALGRLADAVAARLPLSGPEARRRLQRMPFTFATGLSRSEADRLAVFFRSLGAEIDVRCEGDEPQPLPPADAFIPVSAREVARTPSVISLIGVIIRRLAPALLIVSFIFLGGLAQLLAAHLWSSPDGPLFALSASGWVTIGAALLGLGGILLFRLPLIARLWRPAVRSTPLLALRSYLQAINQAHWHKALSCLACRPDGPDLGSEDHDQQVEYLMRLRQSFVFDEKINPATVSFHRIDTDVVELRVGVTLTTRKPMSDGTRMRRAMIDALRFVKLDGAWLLIDGRLLGQRHPARLPLPGCRACGEDLLLGQPSCSACGTPVPPYAQESERWLAPRRKPDIAALLSAVIPGLGQTYNGQPFKGFIVAALSWAILPWAAGVIDAAITADRINRNSMDPPEAGNRTAAMVFHVAMVLAAVGLAFVNARQVPLLREIISASQPPPADPDTSTVVARFRGDDGRYSILFPYGWQVEEQQPAAEPDDSLPATPEGPVSVRAVSPDGNATIIITTRKRNSTWAPCPQAIEARRILEHEGEIVANLDCGTVSGRQQYRIDSYTADNQWRRTLLVMSYPKELVVLAFVCPVEQQGVMVQLFERISNSLRFVESSDTAIRR